MQRSNVFPYRSIMVSNMTSFVIGRKKCDGKLMDDGGIEWEGCASCVICRGKVAAVTSVQLSSSPSVFSSCVLFGFPCFHGEYFGGGDLR